MRGFRQSYGVWFAPERGPQRTERRGACSATGPVSEDLKSAPRQLVAVSARGVTPDNIARPHPGHTGTRFSDLDGGDVSMVERNPHG